MDTKFCLQVTQYFYELTFRIDTFTEKNENFQFQGQNSSIRRTLLLCLWTNKQTLLRKWEPTLFSLNLCIFSIAADTCWWRSSLIKETEVLFLRSRGVTITQKMRGRGDVYSWKLISLWYGHIVRLNVLWCVRHLNLVDKSRLEKTTLLLLKQRNLLLSCLVLFLLKTDNMLLFSPLNLII